MFVFIVLSWSWTDKSERQGMEFRINVIENDRLYKIVNGSLIGNMNQSIVDEIN